MKKKLFFLSLVAVLSMAKAQQLSVTYQGNTVNNGDTITLTVTPNTEEVLFPLVITNTSRFDEDIIVFAINMPDSNSDIRITGMCAGQCWPGMSTEGFTVEAGRIYSDFHALLEFGDSLTVGTTASFYFGIRPDNLTQVIYNNFVLKVVVGNVSVQNAVAENTLRMYPNPAKDMFTLYCRNANLSANAKVQIVNDLGAIVKELLMTSDNMQISVKDMPAGVYACRITDGKKLLDTKKLIVR